MVLEKIWEAMVLLMNRLGGFAPSCGGTDLRKGFDSCGSLNEMASVVSDSDLLVPVAALSRSFKRCGLVGRSISLELDFENLRTPANSSVLSLPLACGL